MSELFGALLELSSVFGLVRDHAPLIAAVTAIPMLSVMSWQLVAKRTRAESTRPARPLELLASASSLLETGASEQPDPIRLFEDFARKRGAHVLVLPSTNAGSTQLALDSKVGEAVDVRFGDFLRAYRHIPADMPIDVILPYDRALPLWFVTRAARLLASHGAKVTAFVPHQVFGATCLLLFAVNEIRIWRDAALVFDLEDTRAAIKAARLKGRARMEDQALLELHGTLQSARETKRLAESLLKSRGVRRSRAIAQSIADGRFHDGNPARTQDLRAWGLNVKVADVIEDLELPDARLPSITLASAQSNFVGQSSRVAPTCSDACPVGDVRDAMVALENRRHSKVISIIHAAGTSSGMLDQQTTAEALKAIRATPPGTNLDIILHTPGGLALGADQLVRALKEHRGRKTFFVPYEAYSAGTILALTGNDIIMSSMGTIGPIDTQIPVDNSSVNQLLAIIEEPRNAFGLIRGYFRTGSLPSHLPAAALASLLRYKRPKKIGDHFLRLAVYARDRMVEDHAKALALMSGNYTRRAASRIAHFLNDGTLSHGYPVQFEEARAVGLHVSLAMPEEVYTIVDSFLFQPGDFCSVIHCSGA